MTTEDAKAAEAFRIEKLADDVAHDVVNPPEDFDEPDLASLALARSAAWHALEAGGTVDDARAAAAEAIADLATTRSAP